jgi:hypothetical protein
MTTENIKTWPEEGFVTKEILGKLPDHIPKYDPDFGNDLFTFYNEEGIPSIKYIRADIAGCTQAELVDENQALREELETLIENQKERDEKLIEAAYNAGAQEQFAVLGIGDGSINYCEKMDARFIYLDAGLEKLK